MALWITLSDEPDFPRIREFRLGPLSRYNRRPFGHFCAEEYLANATADLAEGSTRGLVNAFGNAKRSISYQIDRLLYRFGLLVAAKKVSAALPERLEILAEIRVLPGARLVGFYNRIRNAVEHDYELPARTPVDLDSRAVVEEALELAELLVLATDRPLHDTPRSMIVRLRDPEEEYDVQLEPGDGLLQLGPHVLPIELPAKRKGRLEAVRTSPWIEYLRAFALASRERVPLYGPDDSVIYR